MRRSVAVTPAERAELYRVMTPAQESLRDERIAIMVHDGGQTEAAAEAYCNSLPATFGIVARPEQQDSLGLPQSVFL